MVSALICSHGRAALPSIVCLPRRHMICLFDPMMNSDNNESEHNVMMCWWRLHVRVMGSCSSGGRSLIIGGEAAGPDPRLVSSRPHFKVSLSNMLHCSLLKKNNKKKTCVWAENALHTSGDNEKNNTCDTWRRKAVAIRQEVEDMMLTGIQRGILSGGIVE